MPKHKAKKEQSTSDSDSGPDDRGPAKKVKSDEEPNSWEIGKNKFVKIRNFKEKWYVDVREFYDAGGEMKPTKKGLMLTMEQWQKFVAAVPEVNNAIKKHV